MVAMSAEGISKKDFADAVGVTPGRVSQWISAGQIHGEALVGSGRKARIRTHIAKEQLSHKLDVAHRARASTKAQLADAGEQPTTRSARPLMSDVEQQIQAERLEGYRRDNRRKAEEEAARSGRYTLTADVERAMGRLAAKLIGLFESWLGELASKIAAKFALPQRDVLHLLRSEFRLFRSATSAAMRRDAVQLPELVEDGSEEGHAIGADAEQAPNTNGERVEQ
jgi:transcriptional regulator with XRE-family HTH domain